MPIKNGGPLLRNALGGPQAHDLVTTAAGYLGASDDLIAAALRAHERAS